MTRRGQIRIGTSGWRYARWRGDFYPVGLRQRDELGHLAQRVNTLELNGSFYSLQRPDSFRAWAASTPDDFIFAVKGGRYITHLRKLVDVETALANHCASGILALGTGLGPTLWQLPARLAFDAAQLETFLALLPRTAQDVADLAARHDDKVPQARALTRLAPGVDPRTPVRHALEPRHESFANPRASELLSRYAVALVESDSAGTWPRFEAVTSDFGYVRLHGETTLYSGGYCEGSLDRWATKLGAWAAEGRDAYVYFDNDADGRAPYDAVALLARVRELPAVER
ncbi:DUF72 domain-containing protein [Pedococcus sp. KACC 23699]|uniref:DUF72 domain-containing protein n=1 Tax=Pedococcus sp. KACC 23699 TaxID=3149228 RepID=A0AAU7JSC1_9MICO